MNDGSVITTKPRLQRIVVGACMYEFMERPVVVANSSRLWSEKFQRIYGRRLVHLVISRIITNSIVVTKDKICQDNSNESVFV